MFLSKERFAEDRGRLLSEGARLCFLGIGGVSMHALALLCRTRGIEVFGADRAESERTQALRAEGVAVHVPHAGAALDRASAVVTSLAVGAEDADVLRARARGIPIFSRGALLGALMEEYALSVAVSGTHGKSTVTAMLASVLSALGREPTVLSGAGLSESEGSFRIGGRALLVAEACEYGDSFLSLRPSVSLFLNLEWDHPDYFADAEQLMRSFARAAEGSGSVLYNAASPMLSRMIGRYGIGNCLSVGRERDCDYRYEILAVDRGRVTLRFDDGREAPVVLSLSVPGRFQAENAAMVLAAASYLGIAPSQAAPVLARFSGIGRRLSRIGGDADAPLYYDYAHHPTEIRETLAALREMHATEITVLFRPHTFTRTAALFSDFAAALSLADRVLVTDIDGARESAGAVSAEQLAAAAGGVYLPLSSAADALRERRGVRVLMGAGDLSSVLSALGSDGKKKG